MPAPERHTGDSGPLKRRLVFAVRKFLIQTGVISQEEKIIERKISELEQRTETAKLKDIIKKL